MINVAELAKEIVPTRILIRVLILTDSIHPRCTLFYGVLTDAAKIESQIPFRYLYIVGMLAWPKLQNCIKLVLDYV